jgi:type I restriction enzyme S subunit
MTQNFKQTEVGAIPLDWELSRLDCLIDPSRSIRYGIVQPGRNAMDGSLMLRSQDYSKGWTDSATMHRAAGDLVMQYQNARLHAGDLVMTVVGANTGQVVEIPIWLNGAVLSRSTARIAINQEVAAPGFIKAQLQSRMSKRQILDCLKEGAQPVISCADVAKFRIPMPPTIAEQEAIAEAIGDANVLIESLQQLLNKKRDLKQGAMQELLTGEKRLPGFQVKRGYHRSDMGRIPKDWELTPLRQGIQLLSGQHVLARYCNVDGDGVAYITGPADFPERVIQHTKFTTSPRAMCRRHDILITVKGSGAGALVLADDEYCISRQLMAIRVREWDAKYIYFWLLRDALTLGAAATGLIPGLSRADILGKAIPIPAAKAEQIAIATVLANMDAEIATLEAKLAKVRNLKQGMMQELLTGRIRLV